MSFDWQELVGYLGSALVVTSLAMTSVVRLRMFSLAGCSAFMVYGLLIESAPILITNVSIACLNIWFLSRELGGRRDLGAIVVPTDSPFLADFLAYHSDGIQEFQPEYDPSNVPDLAIVLTREGLPAGVVLGDKDGSELDLSVDYVVPAYRDSRLGHWLYAEGTRVFRSAGISTLTAEAGNATHRSYLSRVGFDHDEASDRFTLTV